MHAVLRTIALIVVLTAGPAAAQNAPPPPPPGSFGPGELMETGHKFFGGVSRGLASIIEQAVSRWGLPNGYILGQEAGGAFVAGLRYGEGTLYTKNAGDLRVFWQGPSVGYDFGGEGARTMMLVYALPATDAIYQRFAGIDGSAYLIGGFGMTALTVNNIVVVPIRSGVGLRPAPISGMSNSPRRRPGTHSDLADDRLIRASCRALTTNACPSPAGLG